MAQGKWQEWEERPFPLGSSELLYQLKLDMKLYLTLNLAIRSNPHLVTTICSALGVYILHHVVLA